MAQKHDRSTMGAHDSPEFYFLNSGIRQAQAKTCKSRLTNLRPMLVRVALGGRHMPKARLMAATNSLREDFLPSPGLGYSPLFPCA